MKRLSFQQACANYVHRYTMEHVPQWSREQCNNGKHYAPQYRTDREWYDNTQFPQDNDGDNDCTDARHCCSSNASWPLGQWLDAPYKAQ